VVESEELGLAEACLKFGAATPSTESNSTCGAMWRSKIALALGLELALKPIGTCAIIAAV
jgi:hypothetical protein